MSDNSYDSCFDITVISDSQSSFFSMRESEIIPTSEETESILILPDEHPIEEDEYVDVESEDHEPVLPVTNFREDVIVIDSDDDNSDCDTETTAVNRFSESSGNNSRQTNFSCESSNASFVSATTDVSIVDFSEHSTNQGQVVTSRAIENQDTCKFSAKRKRFCATVTNNAQNVAVKPQKTNARSKVSGPQTCNGCKKVLSCEKNLRRHVEYNCPVLRSKQPYCYICNKLFRTLAVIKVHILKFHKIKLTSAEASRYIKPIPNKNTTVTKISCAKNNQIISGQSMNRNSNSVQDLSSSSNDTKETNKSESLLEETDSVHTNIVETYFGKKSSVCKAIDSISEFPVSNIAKGSEILDSVQESATRKFENDSRPQKIRSENSERGKQISSRLGHVQDVSAYKSGTVRNESAKIKKTDIPIKNTSNSKDKKNSKMKQHEDSYLKSEKKYQCPICCKLYCIADCLIPHVEKEHKITFSKGRARSCGKSVLVPRREISKPAEQILDDPSVAIKNQHKCNICDQDFTTYNDLILHSESNHNNLQCKWRLKCTTCEKLFPLEQPLQFHVLTLHSKKITFAEASKYPKVLINKSSKNDVNVCLPSVSRLLSQRSERLEKSNSIEDDRTESFKTHATIHSDEEHSSSSDIVELPKVTNKSSKSDLINSKVPEPRTVIDSIKEECTDFQHHCNVCSKSFLSVIALSEHLQSHLFQCID